jgi:hypothetical protein
MVLGRAIWGAVANPVGDVASGSIHRLMTSDVTTPAEKHAVSSNKIFTVRITLPPLSPDSLALHKPTSRIRHCPNGTPVPKEIRARKKATPRPVNGTRRSLLYLNPPADCDEWSRCETGVDQACFCTCRGRSRPTLKCWSLCRNGDRRVLSRCLSEAQSCCHRTVSNSADTIVVYAPISSVERNNRSAVGTGMFAGFWRQIPCRTLTICGSSQGRGPVPRCASQVDLAMERGWCDPQQRNNRRISNGEY